MPEKGLESVGRVLANIGWCYKTTLEQSPQKVKKGRERVYLAEGTASPKV